MASGTRFGERRAAVSSARTAGCGRFVGIIVGNGGRHAGARREVGMLADNKTLIFALCCFLRVSAIRERLTLCNNVANIIIALLLRGDDIPAAARCLRLHLFASFIF